MSDVIFNISELLEKDQNSEVADFTIGWWPDDARSSKEALQIVRCVAADFKATNTKINTIKATPSGLVLQGSIEQIHNAWQQIHTFVNSGNKNLKRCKDFSRTAKRYKKWHTLSLTVDASIHSTYASGSKVYAELVFQLYGDQNDTFLRKVIPGVQQILEEYAPFTVDFSGMVYSGLIAYHMKIDTAVLYQVVKKVNTVCALAKAQSTGKE